MAIGRDTIPVHIINTYTQFPVSGYTPEVYINPAGSSTSKSIQAGIPVADGSGGFEFIDGNTGDGLGTLGTASSPTRTTQVMEISRQDLIDAYNTVNTGNHRYFLAGYIGHNGDSASNFVWDMSSGIIVASSLTSGSGTVMESNNSRKNTQDNSGFSATSTTGLYSAFGTHVSGSGYYEAHLTYGGGRGGITFPSSGDSLTIRITASATVTKDGVDYDDTTAIHDLIVNFTA